TSSSTPRSWPTASPPRSTRWATGRASWPAWTAGSAPSPAHSSSRRAWCGRSCGRCGKARIARRSSCGAEGAVASAHRDDLYVVVVGVLDLADVLDRLLASTVAVARLLRDLTLAE